MKLISKIQIMMATTSLNMGINISDVKCTVVSGFFIEEDDITDV